MTCDGRGCARLHSPETPRIEKMWWRRNHRREELDAGVVADIVARNVAIAERMDDDAIERLCDLATHLVRHKEWEAIGGIDLTDEVLVTLAANAAIPILELGPDFYANVHAVLVHPTTRQTTGLRAGPTSGVVADDPVAIIGQASPHAGPVSISWDAALAESRDPAKGRNVTIHEFAHKIDMIDGYSDGTPPLRGEALGHWTQVLHDEYERSTPDPSDRVLRPYAWSNPAEFFAVATEAFFCTPHAVRKRKPDLYAALAEFYAQDPDDGDRRPTRKRT